MIYIIRTSAYSLIFNQFIFPQMYLKCLINSNQLLLSQINSQAIVALTSIFYTGGTIGGSLYSETRGLTDL